MKKNVGIQLAKAITSSTMMKLDFSATVHLPQREMIIKPGYEEVGTKFLKGQM